MRRALEWLGGSVLVYVLMAACAGGAGSGGDPKASGEAGAEPVASGGVPNVPGTGGEPSSDAAGLGGVLDPVPPAMAAGAGSGGSSSGPSLTYTQRVLSCDGELRSNGTDIPAAIVELEPPSLLRAAQVLAITKSTIGDAEGPWMVAASGGLVSPDGARIGFVCSKATDTVTVFLPD